MRKTLLNIFEESGKEVYQVTKNEWIEIHKDHMLACWKATQEENNIIFTDINKRIENDKIEAICFHREAVVRALKDNIEVPEIVLKDYEGLKEKIENEKRAEEQVPKLTEDIFNTLNIGDKIKINNSKVTVYNKEKNQLICRLYRSKIKAIVLQIGMKAQISIGW